MSEEYFGLPQQTQAPLVNEEDYEYGEGMTLIKPGVGYTSPAASQTGTWIEEKAEKEKADAAAAAVSERPNIRSTKSQRLDHTSTPVIAEEVVMSNGTLVAPAADSPLK
jgi:hypothetical protein